VVLWAATHVLWAAAKTSQGVIPPGETPLDEPEEPVPLELPVAPLLPELLLLPAAPLLLPEPEPTPLELPPELPEGPLLLPEPELVPLELPPELDVSPLLLPEPELVPLELPPELSTPASVAENDPHETTANPTSETATDTGTTERIFLMATYLLLQGAR
jgi:hypothetical protein